MKYKERGGFDDFGFGDSNESERKRNKNNSDEIFEEFHVSHDRELILEKDEKFALLFACCETREMFETVIGAIALMNDHSLAGNINKALRDMDKYWNMATQYVDMPLDERLDLFSNSVLDSEFNAFDAVSRLLWEHATSNVHFGIDPSAFQSRTIQNYPVLSDALNDIPKLIKDARSHKFKGMENVFIRICDCLPQNGKPKMQGSARIAYMQKLINDFDSGVLVETLNPKKFKLNKEAGAMLPHTLDPKEWLGVSVSLLMKKQFSENVIVAFDSSDVNDVRLYNGGAGDYLLCSSEPSSPYHWDRTPALYCATYDDEGKWVWRNQVVLANAKVGVMMQEDEYPSSRRDELLNEELRFRADAFAADKPVLVQSTYAPYLYSLPDEGLFHGAKKVFRFAKRGLSTLKEMEENPEFLHLVSNSVAGNVDSSRYFLILLPDMYTVVVLPLELWGTSNHVRLYDLRFSTPYGLQRPSSDYSSMQLLFALMRVSHVFNMFDCWENKKVYDFNEHAEALNKTLLGSRSPKIGALFAGSPLKSRAGILSVFSSITRGVILGMWISPITTKSGKVSVEGVHKAHRFGEDLEAIRESFYDEAPKRGFVQRKEVVLPAVAQETFQFGNDEDSSGDEKKTDN